MHSHLRRALRARAVPVALALAIAALAPATAAAAPDPSASRLGDRILDPVARGNVTFENTANIASYQQDGCSPTRAGSTRAGTAPTAPR